MKLYTEEQVKKAMDGFSDSDCSMQDVIDRLTPIELPSDEEIENISKGEYYDEEQRGFISGANWMKEQILNQNK